MPDIVPGYDARCCECLELVYASDDLVLFIQHGFEARVAHRDCAEGAKSDGPG